MALQAKVFWENVRFDWLLQYVAVAIMVVSLLSDIVRGDHYFFQLSGVVMMVAAAWLAYRSLNKHWIKAERSYKRGYWLRTSSEQKFVDGCTLVILIIGTLVGTYGEEIFQWLLL